MRHKWKITTLALALLLGSYGTSQAQAQHGGTACPVGVSCHPHYHRCPPPFIHWREGPPNIRYKQACPRPVCHPCDMPNFGYFQPCWRPWSFPPDSPHCPAVPPAAIIHPGPLPATAYAPATEDEPLPRIPVSSGAEKLPPPLPDNLTFCPSGNTRADCIQLLPQDADSAGISQRQDRPPAPTNEFKQD